MNDRQAQPEADQEAVITKQEETKVAKVAK